MRDPQIKIDWAFRFARHWIDELGGELGPTDATDWGYELYRLNADRRPEDVAQEQWRLLQRMGS
jgi:hypothetical protein